MLFFILSINDKNNIRIYLVFNFPEQIFNNHLFFLYLMRENKQEESTNYCSDEKSVEDITFNQELITELNDKKLEVKVGNENKISKQHNQGKFTARKRIELLLDPQSFSELGLFVKHHCNDFEMDKKSIHTDGVVTGHGTINGRLVYVYAQDFTIIGGTVGKAHADKIKNLIKEARMVRAPVIGLIDTGGARIQEGINSLAGYGGIFQEMTKASGVIPQISVILGPSAGGGVYTSALSDFVFMTENITYAFITGPRVLKSVTGRDISLDNLGGAYVHSHKSGVAHFVHSTEEETLQAIRDLIDYLPSDSSKEPPIIEAKDTIHRKCSKLDTIIPADPKETYDMKKVLIEIVDKNSFYEIQADWAANLVTAFARLNGYTIGLVANQSIILAGALDIDASDKASRFIRFCDAFNIPIITFVDVPGFLPGVDQEHNGIIRHGAKILYAYAEATVPKISIITRKAYGGAYICMSSKDLGGDRNYAWPTAEIAVMGIDGAMSILYKKNANKDQNKENLEAFRKEYKQKFMTPYRAAEYGYIDDIIQPAHTRIFLINELWTLLSKKIEKTDKKHGNIPL